MILNVENLTHGFGDRAIFNNVSFRLLAGEHIGLVGANGEGKSTFMNIVTGTLTPDEGKVEWNKHVRVGYLDQHAVLEKGMTIEDILKSAFSYLFDMEQNINEIYESMADATDDEIAEMMEEVGTLQDMLTNHDFYMIDAKVEQVARALGLLELGLDHDVTDLSGGQRTKVLLAKLLLEKPEILLLDEPTNYLDAEHIEWLKRYLQEYENAFILISHDIPFLNDVVNIIYHMENQELNRYVGNYDKFLEVYEAKKAQQEAAYRKQQQEINELKDFVARNKARVATRNMAMSRQKKLDKMDVIELAKEKPKPEFYFKEARTPGKMLFRTGPNCSRVTAGVPSAAAFSPPLTALSVVLSAAPCMGSGARMFCAVPLAVTVGSSSGCACPCSRMAVMAKLTSRMPATAPANRMTPPGPPLRRRPVL